MLNLTLILDLQIGIIQFCTFSRI